MVSHFYAIFVCQRKRKMKLTIIHIDYSKFESKLAFIPKGFDLSCFEHEAFMIFIDLLIHRSLFATLES